MPAQFGQPPAVAEIPDVVEGCRERLRRTSPGIAHPDCLPSRHDQGARLEVFQLQGCVVELLPGFGIGGLQNLKSAVQSESLDEVSPDASSDIILGFEQQYIDPSGNQMLGTAQARQACSDDDDWFSTQGLAPKDSSDR